VAAVAKGYRTSKLMGSDVVNDHDERIGTIDDIIIGRDRVLFAVIQVGGFLGLGGHLVAVPYQALILEDTGGKSLRYWVTEMNVEDDQAMNRVTKALSSGLRHVWNIS
jgi:hypothetical protein